ncbi:MAG: hypothetical protein L6R39_000230 [Caloplaca ligustica]|nr:MAG: hypothetical protein L6R39_000230 [Caloplaca ligustica]
MATLDIQLKNNTTSSHVYASITGLALDKNNALFLLTSDGKTPYYPAQPGKDQHPTEQNVAIPLGNPGSTRTVTVPHLAGSRIYFSIGEPLKFLLNRGGNGAALVAPSINNPTDPNFNTQWSFCEFTFDHSQLFCNITYVDFVGLPISLSLTEKSGQTQHVTGIGANGLESIANKLRSQAASDHQPWGSLIYAPHGRVIRILSPNNAIVGNRSLFAGYYEPYVDQVWSKYRSVPLSIDTQIGDWGTLRGKVGQNNQITFPNPRGQPYTFAKPSTADIFSCSTGPFNLPNNEYGNLGARIAAGLNRSTMLTSDVHPGAPPKDYYKSNPTNHYSRIVHAVNHDRLGYAFPYDDVTPSNGQDQSGKVASGSPKSFTVAVGGGQQVRIQN